jgi:hypothetical protein
MGGVLTLTGFLSRRKALKFSDYGLLLLVEDSPIRQRVLFKSILVEWLSWLPDVLGSLWLMASATRGK